MKTILKYIILSVVVVSSSSCKKFLDREPISQITPEKFFTTEQNAEAAVSGMYRTMLGAFSYGQSMVIVPEFSARQVNHASSFPEYVEFKENRVRLDNPWVLNIWNAAYATINAANNVIVKVAEMPTTAISEDKKLQFIREAKFVRALSYFNLVRAFGDVPLILTPTAEDTDLKVPRNLKAEVYKQILADLTEASLLPNGYASTAETKGRATDFAAKALLAKVQLYNGTVTNVYTEAASSAKSVISEGGFALASDFSSIWTDENTPESIFELQFEEQATNPLAAVSNPSASLLFYAEGQSVAQLYDSTDKRRDYTVYKNSETDVKYYIGKYRQFSPAVQNFPVIRLAEVLLIHAEAQARVDGSVSLAAFNSYKAVRDRAGITTPERASFTSLATFITAVQKEKRKELMFEGETWFDYCRTGLALTDIMTVADKNFYLYPIPDAERRINQNLTQNPGY
jgi:hypothetical protein